MMGTMEIPKESRFTFTSNHRTTLIEDCFDFCFGVPLLLEFLHVLLVLLSPFLDTLLHGLGNALALRTGDEIVSSGRSISFALKVLTGYKNIKLSKSSQV